jgi:cobalt/nickel transport system ATP-binding protein
MTPLIQTHQIAYRYPDGTHALRGIDLQVNDGEKVALVGPNGAGKSTLLLLLNGLFQSEGEIVIDGLTLNKANQDRIRALLGVVFQNPDDQLFSPTVFEDVAFGPIYQGLAHEDVEQRAIDALRAVHMLDYIKRNPYHLSGGEKKRIAIATVLAMQPRALLMDEPTAGLDPRARRELIELLEELPQALVIATHDLEMVRRLTPRMVILNHGELIRDGVSADLLGDKDMLLENGLV